MEKILLDTGIGGVWLQKKLLTFPVFTSIMFTKPNTTKALTRKSTHGWMRREGTAGVSSHENVWKVTSKL